MPIILMDIEWKLHTLTCLYSKANICLEDGVRDDVSINSLYTSQIFNVFTDIIIMDLWSELI